MTPEEIQADRDQPLYLDHHDANGDLDDLNQSELDQWADHNAPAGDWSW